MPLWVFLAGGAALVLWLASKQSIAVNITPGAASYRISTSGANYWTSDPSLGSGMTGIAPAKAGVLAASTTVYATATPPVLSSDAAYELILAPGIGQVWVSISSIVAQ